jgi:hypothetical protein
MDTDALITHIRGRFDHESQKRILREKYEAKMLFAHAGGMWRAGPELQTTLLTCPDPDAVILDLYQTPVKVNTKELFALSQQRWQEQMSAWWVEHESLRRQR